MPVSKPTVKSRFETISCPCCGSLEYSIKETTFDRFHLDGQDVYQIVSCLKCHFIYLNPRPGPDAVSEFYSNGSYQPFLSTKSRKTLLDWIYLGVRNHMVRWKRRQIERRKRRGQLLDIGCGTGEFLHEMAEHGWQVQGIEKDEKAAQYARVEYGLSVFDNGFDGEAAFDVVTMWHVLEHLHEPIGQLRKIRTLLRDDGLLIVAVPNIFSFDAGYYGENWVALDAPRHLHHFVPASLGGLCEQAGLEIVKQGQLPFDTFYNCIMSEMLLMKRRARGKLLLPFYLKRALFIAFVSLTKGSQGFGNGSSMLYFIKPK